MATVNIHEAKTHLSRLLEDVARGDEVIVAKAGKPVARLVAMKGRAPRKAGYLKRRMRIAADFDAPLGDDVVAAFEGA